MNPMRPDQIQDFYKNFLRHLQYEGELPSELREQLNKAKEIGLLVSPDSFKIQFVDATGNIQAYKHEIPKPNEAIQVGQSSSGWELVG